MGNEAACTLKKGKHQSIGKALLETSEILFRPVDGGARLKIPFSAMKSVGALDGELRVETSEGMIVFQLGKAAEKWREKIVHPKSRAAKLGLKAGATVSLLGAFDSEFLDELNTTIKKATVEKVSRTTELIFLAVTAAAELRPAVNNVARAMQGPAGLWIVYPKGRKEITENDVLTAGRKAGLADVKVVGFSPTHTALKFVLPVAKR